MKRLTIFSIYIYGAVQVLLAQSPSNSQNFIIETLVRESGVTTQSQLDALPVSGANRTIQYLDGLGRPMQTVQWQGSPNKKDVVQHIEYDSFGRESRKYLPYIDAGVANGYYKTGGNTKVLSFYNNTSITDVVRTEHPYSETVLENSPLNRVQQQGAPGADWQPYSAAITNSGHTARTDYDKNETGEVLLWRVNQTTNGASAKVETVTKYYDPGKLYKTVVKDENWVSGKAGTLEEYKDFFERVVLKRVWKSETEALNTYYIYDDLGNLRYVLPPAFTAMDFTEEPTDHAFQNYIYAYKYDERKRVTEKKIPGKGWQWIVYNDNDLAVLTQDAVQRDDGKWNYTKYDVFGRVTETGIHTATYVTRADAQAAAYTHATTTDKYWESRTVDVDPITPTGYTRYTNDSFPTDDLQPLIINYYDDHFFEGADTEGLEARDIVPSARNRTLLTGTMVYKDDGTSPLLTINYYDDRARLIQSANQNHLGGTDYVTNTYSFVGELLTSKLEHKASPMGDITTILTTNDYDHVGRLLTVKHQINTGDEVILVKNEYNKIGQLTAKSVGGDDQGTNFHTVTNYAYNERGWMTENISNEFKQYVHYNTPNGLGIPQFNGNISEIHWGRTATPTADKYFYYHYDALNRLKEGHSLDYMLEKVQYDDMGNITELRRADDSTDGTTEYTYTGNRLMSLSGAITGNYSYDVNGNATNDRTGMTFTYNHLNLPKSAISGTVTVNYLYDALGTKLRRTSTQSGQRDYAGGIEYGSNGNIEFIHTGEGIAYRNTSDNTYTYRYNLTDHLGNIRATVYRNPATQQVEVLQADDYYPFGKQYVVSAGDNKYLYNGKELQPELGLDQYDYGARFYDAEIGRWNVVDPLAEKYISFSPYNYVVNNPVNAVDPDGKDIIFISGNSQYRYRNGYLYQNGQQIISLRTDGNYSFLPKNLQKALAVYQQIERSGDNVLINTLHTLVNSKNKHYVLDINSAVSENSSSYVIAYGKNSQKSYEDSGFTSGSDTRTFYNFDNQYESGSNLETVFHEFRHQLDIDKSKLPLSNHDREVNAVSFSNYIRRKQDKPLRYDHEYFNKSVTDRDLNPAFMKGLELIEKNNNLNLYNFIYPGMDNNYWKNTYK